MKFFLVGCIALLSCSLFVGCGNKDSAANDIGNAAGEVVTDVVEGVSEAATDLVDSIFDENTTSADEFNRVGYNSDLSITEESTVM